MNLNIKAEGQNEHHKIEGIFKAVARSIKMAVRRDIYYFEGRPVKVVYNENVIIFNLLTEKVFSILVYSLEKLLFCNRHKPQNI